MTENYTRAESYTSRSGVTEILTVTVATNTGTLTTDAGEVNLFQVVGARESELSLTSIVSGVSGDTLTDSLLNSLPVSYFDHTTSGPVTTTYLSGANAVFRKDVPGDDLVFTDGVTVFSIADVVDVYTLPAGNGYASDDLLESQVPDEVEKMMARLKREVDGVQNIDLYDKLVALGFRYDA